MKSCHVFIFFALALLSCSKDVPIKPPCYTCPVAPPRGLISFAYNGTMQVLYSSDVYLDSVSGHLRIYPYNSQKCNATISIPAAWMSRETVDARSDSFMVVYSEFVPYPGTIGGGYNEHWWNDGDSATFKVDSITANRLLYAKLTTTMENIIYTDQTRTYFIEFHGVKIP